MYIKKQITELLSFKTSNNRKKLKRFVYCTLNFFNIYIHSMHFSGKLISFSLLCGGSLLGLTIMAVICRLKQDCAAKSNRVVTPQRIRPQSNIYHHQAAFNDATQTTKYPISDYNVKGYNNTFDTSVTNIFPTLYPRYNPRLPTNSPRENITRNNSMNIKNCSSFENKSQVQGVPKHSVTVNKQIKSDIFITKPKLELECFDETSKNELDECFYAASETLSELKPISNNTRESETSSSSLELPLL